MQKLGNFVLRQAMADGRRWPGLRVAVNVSASQFRARDFVSRVKRCLAETGFEPACLEIELTEGILQADADSAGLAIAQLRAAGVRLTLDDFGAGTSSLINLRRFQFDKIKIARAFVAGAGTGGGLAILSSIAQLGRALGLTVAVKGVETSEELSLVHACGCEEVQGYLFAAAQPAEAIGLWAAKEAGGQAGAATDTSADRAA
jgi:diguanylate cyclase